ncbi:unnamed protein product, partial [Adineta steineri]
MYVIIIIDNTFEVLLNRGHNGLGLSLAGGIAENKPIEIIDIYENQPAALSGQLDVGDVVLSINDVAMQNRNVRDVPTIIGVTRNVKLLVCRPDPKEYQSYLDHQIDSPNRSATSGSVSNDQSRISNNAVRDLPPNSP